MERGKFWTVAAFSSATGGIGTMLIAAAGIAAGMAVTGPVGLAAGAAGLAAVGAIGLLGALSGAATLFRGQPGGKQALALAALFTSMAAAGAGVAGYQTGKALQAARMDNLSVPVSSGLQRAFDAGIDPDRLNRIRQDIADYATRRMEKEATGNYELCAQNPDAFAQRGIRCDIYRPAP
jgi:hypothetical protein